MRNIDFLFTFMAHWGKRRGILFTFSSFHENIQSLTYHLPFYRYTDYMTSQQEPLTITGFIQVLPKSQGREDIARVVIITTDGTQYPILHKGAGVDLIDHISADVEVTATIEDAPLLEGAKGLKVRRYKFMDGYEDSWYDDE